MPAAQPVTPTPAVSTGHNRHTMSDVIDVIVIGAGPVGLACAIEAKREGLRPLVIDKGALVNSIVGYPARMEFFSTPELIEIGGHPFPDPGLQADARGSGRVLPHASRRRKKSTSASTSASSA